MSELISPWCKEGNHKECVGCSCGCGCLSADTPMPDIPQVNLPDSIGESSLITTEASTFVAGIVRHAKLYDKQDHAKCERCGIFVSQMEDCVSRYMNPPTIEKRKEKE